METTPDQDAPALAIKGPTRTYWTGHTTVHALSGKDLRISRGEPEVVLYPATGLTEGTLDALRN